MAAQSLSGILTGDFSFHAQITINDPTSGFRLVFGETGVSLTESFAFSGFSGYVFDWSGDFVGGYRSGDVLDISGAMFLESPIRVAYSIDNVLIKNDMHSQNDTVDTVSFDSFGGGGMALQLTESFQEEIYVFLQSSDVLLLQSSDGYFLTSLT